MSQPSARRLATVSGRPPRAGAQIRLNAQTVDQAAVFDGIMKTCWRSGACRASFSASRKWCRYCMQTISAVAGSPGDGGDGLLQLGQLAPAPP